jgi:predicted ATPase
MKSAQFTHIHLSNWRNFRTVDLELKRRVFIVGPNASGKTNLLDAFRFLRDIAQPGGSLARAAEVRGGIAHLRSLHARQNSNVVVSVVVNVDGRSWKYLLELTGTKTKPLRVEREIVSCDGREILARPVPADVRDPRLRQQTHLEQLTQNGDFRELVDVLASTDAVHVVPQIARNPRRFDDSAMRDAPGSDFIERLARLSERARTKALKLIGQQLRVAVPRFHSLRVERDKLGTPHLEASYQHWRPRGGWQNEQEFSDGTLRLVGLLWAIETGSAPLLLEEPELSLHRAVIQQLPRLFARAAQRSERQVLVSTHAEEMLSDRGIDPAEVVLIEPTDEGSTATLGTAKAAVLRAARARLPLGNVVTSLTKPKHVEQLALPFAAGRAR